MATTRKIATVCSFGVLLAGSLIFGFMGHAAEMGLAIAAGAIGLVFLNLEQIASFKGAGIEFVTKEQKEQIDAVIDKETEQPFLKVEAYGTDDETKKVIFALKNPNYTWRYVSGLAEESGQTEVRVQKALEWLAENQLGRKSKGKKGEIWSLTQKGREVFEKLNVR
jgi:hypothetical protein